MQSKITDEEILEFSNSLDLESNLLKTYKSGVMLTNYETQVLDKYNIDYRSVSSLKEIIYLVEEVLNEDSSLDDLENISLSISERDYYMNTNK
ncbi:MAG: hypothetical protein IK997_05855 [Bacilli bacterium]|nr:hypothetical protein [Bacilli bacterium]